MCRRDCNLGSRAVLLFLIILLEFLEQVEGRWSWYDRGYRRKGQTSFIQLPEILSKNETDQFMLYAYGKIGRVNCATFVWDKRLSYIVESLAQCNSGTRVRVCTAYKFVVNYEGGNLSSLIQETLEAGYTRQCGSYVILLKGSASVLNFLQQGLSLQVINSRARFLIWYEENDKKFEGDGIWEKIPNVILFHSKAKKRQSGVLFTVRELKWPVIPNTTESHTRVIEFWGEDHLGEEGQTWYYDKTTDLKNMTLRIVVVEHPPGVIKYVDAAGNVEYAGIEIEIVKVLSNFMNFAYEFIDAESGAKWGGQVMENGTVQGYYGAVARLIYGQADIGIGSFYILKHYMSLLDFSIPMEVVCTSFLTPNPLPRPRYLALILPFRYQLWLLVLTICFFLCPMGLYALVRLGHHETEHPVFRKKFHTVLTSFRLMTQVALHVWPRFWSIRLYIGWYWLFWLCMTLAYRAAMVSFLTIPLYENAIDSLDDLAKSSLRIGGWGTELERLFTQHEATKDHVRGILNKRYEVVGDLDSAISMVAEGNFALFENLRYLRFVRMTRNLTRIGSPSMRLMKQCIVPVHIGFAYQKNSPLARTINRYIRKLQESGLVKRWSQRLVLQTREYNRNNAGNEQAESDDVNDVDADDLVPDSNKSRKQRVLTLQDLQGAVYLILLGVLLSLFVFLAELFFGKRYLAAKHVNKELLLTMVGKTKYCIQGYPELDIDVRNMNKKKKKGLRKRRKHNLPFQYIE